MSNLILAVSSVYDAGDEWLFPCPHCGHVRGVLKEDSLSNLMGEQYQDNLCGNWQEISNTCTVSIRTVEELHELSDAKILAISMADEEA